jgi:hypothetical protein
MIFATEQSAEVRRQLARDMASGKVSDEEGCTRILHSDPDDIAALRFFAESALESGDYPAAERYARHMVRVHPLGYEGYLLLSRALAGSGPASPLAFEYAQAAVDRLRYDEDSLASVNLPVFAAILGTSVEDLSKSDALTRIAEFLHAERAGEPAHVTDELEPHRLIQHMFESSDELLDPSVVDAVLRLGKTSAPLLCGVLKEWGAGILEDEDRPLVERALALLGEIGDPAFLPELTEFLLDQDDYLSGPADWAFRRIAVQHPEAALCRIREMIPVAGPTERFVIAQQVGEMPEVPGRREAILSLAEGIEDRPQDQREAVIVASIAALMMVEGGESAAAASLEERFSSLLSGKSRGELRSLRKEALAHGSLTAESIEYSIYQICCEEPEEHDDGPRPVVHTTPKPGRNDPCWCGSGKKYKKCHLPLDDHH